MPLISAQLCQRPLAVLGPHPNAVICGWFSDDGRRILTLSYPELGYQPALTWIRSFHTWDARTGKHLASWSEPQAERDDKDTRTYVDGSYSADFSPDGRLVVVTVGQFPGFPPQIRETDTGDVVHTLDGHEGPVNYAKFSPDGQHVVTTSMDTTARLWSVQTGNVVKVIGKKNEVSVLAAFRPDGRQLLTVYESAYVGFDSKARAPIKHENRRQLVGRIWDVQTGNEVRRLQWSEGRRVPFQQVRFLSDGKRIVVAGNGNVRVGRDSIMIAGQTYPHLWDAESGEHLNPTFQNAIPPRARRTGTNYSFCPSASPDGYCSLVRYQGAQSEPELRYTQSGELIAKLLGHDRNDIHSAEFSPDGQSVVTAGTDKTARIWTGFRGNVPCPKRGYWPDAGWTPSSLVDSFRENIALSKSGRWLLTGFYAKQYERAQGMQRQGVLWDTTQGKKVASLLPEFEGANSPSMTCADISPDESKAILGFGKQARLFELPSGKHLGTLNFVKEVQHVRFSPDGERVLVIVYSSGSVWDVTAKKKLFDFPHSGISDVAFSPDNRHLAVADFSDGYRIRVLDSATGKTTRSLKQGSDHGGTWSSVTYHPSGKWLLASVSNHVYVWDCRTWNEMNPIDLPKARTLNWVGFSPDGRSIVGTFNNSRDLRLWEFPTGKLIHVLSGHENSVLKATFSPDGSKLLSMGDEYSIRLWDLTTGTELANFRHQDDAPRLAEFAGKDRILTVFGSTAQLRSIDFLEAAQRRAPRELTPSEREQFLLSP